MGNPISKICDHDTNVMKIRSDCSIIFKGKNPWKSVKVSKEEWSPETQREKVQLDVLKIAQTKKIKAAVEKMNKKTETEGEKPVKTEAEKTINTEEKIEAEKGTSTKDL